MEEDIKILEEYIKILKLTPEELLKSDEIVKFIEYKEIKALENLLTRYKQLEEENKKFNPEVWHNEGWDRADEYWKSKVKEKIEELEQEDLEIYDTDSEDLVVAKYEYRAVLDALQELLREE